MDTCDSVQRQNGNAATPETPATTELARLYRTHATTVRRYIGYLGLSEHDADDVSAEVFLRAARALDRDPTTTIGQPWLFRVAHNCVIDAWRHRQRWRARLQAVAGDLAPKEAPSPYVWDERVHNALESLRPNHRRALVLKYVEGRSSTEIGQIIGLRRCAVDSLMGRARNAFRFKYEAAAGPTRHLECSR